MNRKDFLKRLGLLSTIAITTPVLLDPEPTPPKNVERARFGSNGSLILKDKYGNITYHVTHDGRVLVGEKY
jgi:hypothetical protein